MSDWQHPEQSTPYGAPYPTTPAPPPSAYTPPGGYPYPYGPPPAHAPTVLAGWTIALAVAMAVVQVLIAATSWSAAEAYREAAREGRPGWDVLTARDGASLLAIPVLIATYVVACLWLQACRRNAVQLRPQDPHARSSVWVWLGWWVPVVSFWFPFQVVRDVRYASCGPRNGPGLGLWWTAWIVWAVLDRISSQMVPTDEIDLSVVDAMPTLATITAVVSVIGAVRWIQVVRGITAGQRALVALR